jgi:hypothetical protein
MDAEKEVLLDAEGQATFGLIVGPEGKMDAVGRIAGLLRVRDIEGAKTASEGMSLYDNELIRTVKNVIAERYRGRTDKMKVYDVETGREEGIVDWMAQYFRISTIGLSEIDQYKDKLLHYPWLKRDEAEPLEWRRKEGLVD